MNRRTDGPTRAGRLTKGWDVERVERAAAEADGHHALASRILRAVDTPALAMISAERLRAVNRNGYTASHDDQYDGGELVAVAHELLGEVHPTLSQETEDYWGIIANTSRKFDGEELELRLLVIVGNLVAAEIDRRLRATPE